jgi:hypothetical protein
MRWWSSCFSTLCESSSFAWLMKRVSVRLVRAMEPSRLACTALRKRAEARELPK